MSRIAVTLVLLPFTALAIAAGVTAINDGRAAYEPGEEQMGGDTSVEDHGRNAFSYPAANLSLDRQTPFFIGNSFFKKNWVEAPASTSGRDGLGPHFITRSCAGCHALDGRGAPPAVKNGRNAAQPVSLLLRLSIPGDGGKDGVVPEPTYGGQLNNFAINGIRAEGKVAIRYTTINGRFADGTRYTLQHPQYRISDPAYGPLHPATLISPRIAPQVIGLGLLEAIRADDILANATRQQQDREQQGISGRPNRVWDAAAQDWVIGRFGWKANVGSVAHQTAGAFNGDMGVTSPMFPHEECSAAQTDCRARQQQEMKWKIEAKQSLTDIDQRALDQVIFYTRTLAVPTRRNAQDKTVLQGKQLFTAIGCASCHTPAYTTGTLPDLPELSGQKIFPYTDLLLHDMGDGLADGRPDFAADGREWRTPPLWGIGLIETVNAHSRYLHDGRARNLMEAVLWHGGEAEATKQRVLNLPRAQRDALLAFLKSL